MGGVHTCPVCSVHMHPFCGKPVGKEGFGQSVICPKCEESKISTKIPSASPIIAAFQRTAVRKPLAVAVEEILDSSEADMPSSEDESDLTSSEVQRKDEKDRAAPKPPMRSRPAVTPIHQREKVVQWLAARVSQQGKDCEKGMFAAAIDAFPGFFSSRTRNANIAKAMDWFRKKDMLLKVKRGAKSLSAKNADGHKRVSLKAFPGRGRRRSTWVTWLYGHLIDEFD